MYKGVGKMWVSRGCSSAPCAYADLPCCRFVMVPRATMEADLKRQQKELTDDINNLNKKASTPRQCLNLTSR